MRIEEAQEIATLLHLGDITASPQKVTGGLLHKMWKFTTDNRAYAVKQLNPDIMSKSGICAEYETSEQIAKQFAEQEIPVAKALAHEGSNLISIDDNYYIVYEWIAGTTLDMDAISNTHAKKIANIIAHMHKMNLTVPALTKPKWDIHSNAHFIDLDSKLLETELHFAAEFHNRLEDIFVWNDKYQQAVKSLCQQTVVSHGDLDQKNVMWLEDDSAVLVDWESARLLNPTQEIVTIALDWSGASSLQLNEDIFITMFAEYRNSGGVLIGNLSHAFYGVVGNWLNWLEYNIRRSLDDNLSKEDQELGADQAHQTLAILQYVTANSEIWIKYIPS